MRVTILPWRWQRFQTFLYRHCALCRLPLQHDDDHWCQTCLSQFPSTPYCQRCGTSQLTMTTQCGACLADPPPWDTLYRLGEYQAPLQQLISQLKFRHHFWLAAPLATQLAAHIPTPAPLLLPVPLHWRRYWHRGFNQSNDLAMALASHLGSEVAPHILRRTRHTAAQKLLSKHQRHINLNNAFTIAETSLPAHVALVDDVVTTGTTVGLLTKQLKLQGVKQVDIYTICHTEKPI